MIRPRGLTPGSLHIVADNTYKINFKSRVFSIAGLTALTGGLARSMDLAAAPDTVRYRCWQCPVDVPDRAGELGRRSRAVSPEESPASLASFGLCVEDRPQCSGSGGRFDWQAQRVCRVAQSLVVADERGEFGAQFVRSGQVDSVQAAEPAADASSSMLTSETADSTTLARLIRCGADLATLRNISIHRSLEETVRWPWLAFQ